MSIEQKIRALSLKTIENGASAAEAEAAKRMIERLRAPAPVEKPDRYEEYANGGYNNLPIEEVDWDIVARENLNHIQHADYVNETSIAWERYNKTRLRLGPKHPMSRSEYRKVCHDAFRGLFDRKQIE